MKTLKRRRRESKTDYGKRIKLLKGNTPRIVFRKTNKHIIAQYISSKEAQDKIEIGINSKILIKYGWPEKANLKSIPASYLTGILIGKIIIKEKKPTPIVDLGMYTTKHKTKIYAFIKGLIDSGVKIKCEKETFPNEKTITGENMKTKISFKEIKSNIESKN